MTNEEKGPRFRDIERRVLATSTSLRDVLRPEAVRLVQDMTHVLEEARDVLGARFDLNLKEYDRLLGRLRRVLESFCEDDLAA